MIFFQIPNFNDCRQFFFIYKLSLCKINCTFLDGITLNFIVFPFQRINSPIEIEDCGLWSVFHGIFFWKVMTGKMF